MRKTPHAGSELRSLIEKLDKTEVKDDAKSLLGEALAWDRTGEIQSVVLICGEPDGSMRSAKSGSFDRYQLVELLSQWIDHIRRDLEADCELPPAQDPPPQDEPENDRSEDT